MSKNINWCLHEEHYCTLETYVPLKDIADKMQEALGAEARGEWKDLKLETYDDYGIMSIVIVGKRRETEKDRLLREEIAKRNEKHERAMFEALKKKYEGK
jgi:hypothetical protein